MHFTDVLNLAARAWHEVKDANDPEFNQCAVTHRENLGAAAQGVVNSGLAFTPFEKTVLRLYRTDAEAKSEAVKTLAEHPTLHADEVMHITSGTPHPLVGHAEAAQMATVREEFRVDKTSVLSGQMIRSTLRKDGTTTHEHLKGPLPKDFPAHDLLHEAGINTYTQLSKIDDFTSIPGIGPATAEKIANRLVEESQKEN